MKNKIYAIMFGTFLLASIFTIQPSFSFAEEKIFKENARHINQKRIACVIGNSDYKSGPLKNPVNDASAIADLLRSVKFEVLTGSNLRQSQMKMLINQFGQMISDGSVALFYFAGHGMQVNGKNYLIPIDAKINHEDDVDIESINVNRVLSKMSSHIETTNIKSA